MILVDANLLLYAYDSTAAEHSTARAWLERLLSQPEPVLLPWATILAFLRISTNPRAWREALSPADALTIVDEWLAAPNVRAIGPGERHWEIMRELVPNSQARGPLISDAHLAALAIEHGATLCSNDRDFTRFRGLRLLNPLA